MVTGVGGMWRRFMGEFDISQKLGIGMAEIRIMSASSEAEVGVMCLEHSRTSLE